MRINKMTVNMPVECIGPICQNCPELDINISTLYLNVDNITRNSLTCAHYEQCLKLKEYLENNQEENKE